MSLLNVMCKELGVEVGEEWLGNDGDKYKITKNGELQCWFNVARVWNTLDNEWYRRLLTGELKPVWKPMIGTVYYVPRISDTFRYDFYRWKDNDVDNWFLRNNLIFKTEEEAIEFTNKMLEVVK